MLILLVVKSWLLEVVARAATARVRGSFRTPAGAGRVDFWTSDGLRLGGWLFEDARSRGTVILAHGYRDDRRQLAHLAPAIVARGMRALAFDFRAHGESEGKWITVGNDEARDVSAAMHFARSLDRGGGGDVAWVGFSMGAAAYLQHVACGGDEADSCAVLDSPFDTLREAIGARLDRLRVPRSVAHGERIRRDVRFPATDRCRPIDAAPKLARPTLLLFAPHDPWLPAPTIARFRSAMSASCTLEVLATGRHDDHVKPNHRGAQAWKSRILDFVQAHAR